MRKTNTDGLNKQQQSVLYQRRNRFFDRRHVYRHLFMEAAVTLLRLAQTAKTVNKTVRILSSTTFMTVELPPKLKWNLPPSSPILHESKRIGPIGVVMQADTAGIVDLIIAVIPKNVSTPPQALPVGKDDALDF